MKLSVNVDRVSCTRL